MLALPPKGFRALNHKAQRGNIAILLRLDRVLRLVSVTVRASQAPTSSIFLRENEIYATQGVSPGNSSTTSSSPFAKRKACFSATVIRCAFRRGMAGGLRRPLARLLTLRPSASRYRFRGAYPLWWQGFGQDFGTTGKAIRGSDPPKPSRRLSQGWEVHQTGWSANPNLIISLRVRTKRRRNWSVRSPGEVSRWSAKRAKEARGWDLLCFKPFP